MKITVHSPNTARVDEAAEKCRDAARQSHHTAVNLANKEHNNAIEAARQEFDAARQSHRTAVNLANKEHNNAMEAARQEFADRLDYIDQEREIAVNKLEREVTIRMSYEMAVAIRLILGSIGGLARVPSLGIMGWRAFEDAKIGSVWDVVNNKKAAIIGRAIQNESGTPIIDDAVAMSRSIWDGGETPILGDRAQEVLNKILDVVGR